MSRRAVRPPGLSEQEMGLSVLLAVGDRPLLRICDDHLSDLHMLSVLWSLCIRLPEATAFALLTEDAELQGCARDLGAFTLLSPLTVRSFRAAACQAPERRAEDDKGPNG